MFNETVGYWLVREGNNELGIINLTKYDTVNLIGEFGFYLNPKFLRSGMSIKLFYLALNFYFRILHLKHVVGFVKENNNNALMINDFFRMRHVEFLNIEEDCYSKRVISRDDWFRQDVDLNNIQREFVLFVRNNLKAINKD
jgi:hypothetical protein